jgi:hypothetical protein
LGTSLKDDRYVHHVMQFYRAVSGADHLPRPEAAKPPFALGFGLIAILRRQRDETCRAWWVSPRSFMST